MMQAVTETSEAASASPNLKMTYEEFLEWTDEDTRAEWVDGEVVPMSPVSIRHQKVGRFLLRILSEFVEIGRLGEIFYESCQMKTGPSLSSRQPDIFFIATANLSRLRENRIEGPADLVIEIVSPESRSRDRGDKYYEYEQGGVPEYWLIDPIRHQAEFYQRGTDSFYRPAFADSDDVYRSAILSGLWIREQWLWQDPTPTLRAVLKEWGMG